jgi:uncharacterized protein
MPSIIPDRLYNRRFAIALGVGLLSMAIAVPALAQFSDRGQDRVLRTLTVSGRGKEQVQTTLAQVRLGVEVQGKTAGEVQQEMARRSNAVVDLLRSRKVTKLETTGINLNPNYRYDDGKQTLTGYSASNIVSFQVETGKAGEIMDAAVKAGASRIDGVGFVASDDAIAAAQKTALRSATQDAQAQAQAVLSTLGLSSKEIIGIQINNAVAPPPRPVPFAAKVAQDSALAAAPPPVVGGEQQIEAAVTLQISY